MFGEHCTLALTCWTDWSRELPASSVISGVSDGSPTEVRCLLRRASSVSYLWCFTAHFTRFPRTFKSLWRLTNEVVLCWADRSLRTGRPKPKQEPDRTVSKGRRGDKKCAAGCAGSLEALHLFVPEKTHKASSLRWVEVSLWSRFNVGGLFWLTNKLKSAACMCSFLLYKDVSMVSLFFLNISYPSSLIPLLCRHVVVLSFLRRITWSAASCGSSVRSSDGGAVDDDEKQLTKASAGCYCLQETKVIFLDLCSPLLSKHRLPAHGEYKENAPPSFLHRVKTLLFSTASLHHIHFLRCVNTLLKGDERHPPLHTHTYTHMYTPDIWCSWPLVFKGHRP